MPNLINDSVNYNQMRCREKEPKWRPKKQSLKTPRKRELSADSEDDIAGGRLVLDVTFLSPLAVSWLMLQARQINFSKKAAFFEYIEWSDVFALARMSAKSN